MFGLVSSCPEVTLELMQSFKKNCMCRAYPSKSKSLAVWDTFFSSVWVTAGPGEIGMNVCWFRIKISGNGPLADFYLDVQKWYRVS